MHPVAIDQWVAGFLPAPIGEAVPPHQRYLRDALHFSISFLSELRSLVVALPGFTAELVRNGVYPDRMSFRKLPYLPERSDLEMLRRANPDWVFREDFDPSRWVIVFLHGYIDNTGADRVAFRLAQLGYQVYLVRYPFLRDVRELSAELAEVLAAIARREPEARIVPIGHSLGGFVWDHLLLHEPELVERYRMPLYIPIGSPHFGTLAAYVGVGASAVQMRPRSRIVQDHLGRRFPPQLELYPFVSRYDMLVLPIETALHPDGVNYIFSEMGHIAQVIRPETVVAIEEILTSPPELLRERAAERTFYLSSLARVLRRLPRRARERLGLERFLAEFQGDRTARRYRIRIVHHELRLGRLALLAREV